MSLTQLKQEAASLPPREQRELIGFLVALQAEKDADFKDRLAAKIDDRDPTHWMELNEIRRACGRQITQSGISFLHRPMFVPKVVAPRPPAR